ncbi:hypothetical protein PR048_000654 [Dryococelus australis]|uniref:Uncharacterized protein n=1 Tax=Dryococelus australis TaxID=614101 RepID=A0ABQ9IHL8_9NEOP|nr:hypothetical protein PR048_000654 [Dryococelus australis]
MQGRGSRETPEKACRPAASSSTIHAFENPGVARAGIEPVSPWWEADGRPTDIRALAVAMAVRPVTPLRHLAVTVAGHVARVAGLEVDGVGLAQPFLDLIVAAQARHVAGDGAVAAPRAL